MNDCKLHMQYIRDAGRVLVPLLAMMTAGAAPVSGLMTPAEKLPDVKIYVSPSGKDSATGQKGSPVKSIPRAIEMARMLSSDAPRTIVLMDGEYFIEEPIVIGRGDYGLRIKAMRPGRAVLTGSMPVKNWTVDPQDEGLLVAELPFTPEPETQYMMYDESGLFELSTFPEKGRLAYDANKSDGERHWLKFRDGSFPENFDLASIDLTSAWLVLPQEWATTTTLMEEVDAERGRIRMKKESGMVLGDFNQGFFLKNVRPGLTKPGTWMYEAGKNRIVCRPREGAGAKTMNCRLTKSACLIDMNRSQGTVLDGLVIEGCTARFTTPGVWSGNPLAAAVSVRCTRATEIRNCEFRYTAAEGVMYLKANEDAVYDSHFHHIGKTAIHFEDGGVGNVKVHRCEVDHVGVLQPSAAGIYCQIVRVDMQQNHIHDNPGNGAVMWSAWSVFASNHVHHCMSVQRDGGGLYGAYNYTLVKGNYCHDMNGWPCLYADEGSQHTVLTENRCEHWWPTHVHCARFVDVTNNVFKCLGSSVRFSFQGSGGCAFSDNRMTLTRPLKESDVPPLEACRECERNEVTLLGDDGGKTKLGRKSFECGAKDRTLPVLAVREGTAKPQSFMPVQLLGKGSMTGVPGTTVAVTWNGDRVKFDMTAHYNAFGEYTGSRNLGGTEWGHYDGVKLYFGNGLKLEIYADGKFKSNRQGVITAADVKSETVFRGIRYSVSVPLRAIGIDGEPSGEKIRFNLAARNEDHHVTTWTFRPDGKNPMTGELEFL